IEMQGSRDIWWHEAIAGCSDDCPAAAMDSEDLLFILYTSGSTGKPKGIMHTTGGYMVYTYYTSQMVFDLKGDQGPGAGGQEGSSQATGPQSPAPSQDVYWCTADIGWVTGHSYIIYGILTNGVPTLMYEGAPN